MFLHRDRESSKDEAVVAQDTKLILAKQRNGPVGTIEISYLREYTKFVNKAT